MSGIAALFHPDGTPVAEGDMSAMVAMMGDRGPDGATTWCDDRVGLGYARSGTTTEGPLETQPLVDGSLQLAIVADVRLDNRDELTLLFDLSSRDPTRLSDAELILHAYMRWGDACPARLLGDFAFALWDGSRQRLFCARDHLGVKPVYYHHADDRLLALGSTPDALLTLPRIPYRINEARIADFLVDELEGVDKTSTFFEDVHRLPPAHTLAVDRHGIRRSRYWTLEPPPPLTLASEEEYHAAFMEVFTESVRCRLRPAGRTGAMLSGGMDSGSIVAVAADLRSQTGGRALPTYSVTAGDTEHCAESQAILAAQTMPGIDPHTVSPPTWDRLQPDLAELTLHTAEPFDGYMTLVRAVYLAAAGDNTTVVLDGVGGDLVLSDGGQLSRLIRSGRWVTAGRNAAGLARFWGGEPTKWGLLSRSARRAFAPRPARRARAAIRLASNRRRTEESIRRSAISPAFAERIGLADRLRALDRHRIERGGQRGPGWNRARALDHPYLTVALERYDRVAAAAGIEPRHPFVDRRMIRFCLSLPGDQKLAMGWPKWILRRAMEGRVPDAVRWRLGKEHLGFAVTTALLEDSFERRERAVDNTRNVLREYVDLEKAMGDPGSPDRPSRALAVTDLALWLQAYRSRPVAR